MAYLDAKATAGGNTNASPIASCSVGAKNGEVVLAYGVDSNQQVLLFGAPWTNINLNINAFGRFEWVKVTSDGPVGLSYSVSGTQAWCIWMASFGSNAVPTIVSRANGNQNEPFSVTGVTFGAGNFLIAVFEYESNASGQMSPGISDSVGNNWLPLTVAVGTRGTGPQLAQAQAFYVEKAIGGSGITVFLTSTPLNPAPTYAIYEITGLTDAGGPARRLLSLGVGI
jgi:hypothetical protein